MLCNLYNLAILELIYQITLSMTKTVTLWKSDSLVSLQHKSWNYSLLVKVRSMQLVLFEFLERVGSFTRFLKKKDSRKFVNVGSSIIALKFPKTIFSFRKMQI